MTITMPRFIAAALTASLVAVPALVSTAGAADLTPQQQRMSTCAKQNKGKKGDDYKQAQSDCLKGVDTPAAAPMMTPQQKMAMCAKQNKGKKGDDYKQAQSACLKS